MRRSFPFAGISMVAAFTAAFLLFVTVPASAQGSWSSSVSRSGTRYTSVAQTGQSVSGPGNQINAIDNQSPGSTAREYVQGSFTTTWTFTPDALGDHPGKPSYPNTINYRSAGTDLTNEISGGYSDGNVSSGSGTFNDGDNVTLVPTQDDPNDDLSTWSMSWTSPVLEQEFHGTNTTLGSGGAATIQITVIIYLTH